MAEVCFTAHLKCDPAGIGNPAVIFSKTFCQERIAHRTGKRYVNDPADVDMPNFCAAAEEFPISKTLWIKRYIRPSGDFSFEFLQVFAHSGFRCPRTTARSSGRTRFPIQAKMRFDSLGRWNFIMQRTFGLNIPQTLEEICDPTRLALVVYDMQVGIVKQIENGQQITDKVLQVLDAARKAGIRVFFTRHMSLPRELMGVSQFRMAMAWQRIKLVDEVKPWFLRDSPGFHLIPEINPLASEAIFDKIAMSAFEGTPLDIALRDCGINAFAIIGIAMEIGIEPTVRHGADLGYIPVVVKDACGFGHRDAADRSIASLEFGGDALLTNADTFCAQLGRNPST